MTRIPFIYNECEKFSGADLNLIYKLVEGDSKGVNVAGLANIIRENSKGMNISVGANYIGKNSKGMNVGGLANIIEKDSRGANLAGLFNYAGKVDDFLIQYGTIGNTIREVSEEAFVLQVGAYNKIGGRAYPIINIKGLKNLSRLIKNAFKKKNLEKKVLKVKVKKY
ncbi:MAG: hypothetical protein AABY06_02745 [Nanoarchaeota archaeon]